MNSSKLNSWWIQPQSGPTLWYNSDGSPFIWAVHLKHVWTDFQLAVNRQISRNHSQSPLNSHRANLWFEDVIGVPALAASAPCKGLPPSPSVGLIPEKAASKDHTSRRQTLLRVRFFTFTSFGTENNRNRECREESGLKCTMFIQTATTFSCLYCVHKRAASPWMPSGMWDDVHGFCRDHGSPSDRLCSQNVLTSELDICNPTWSKRYARIRCGWMIGYDAIEILWGGFGLRTGTWIVSIS